MGVEPGVVDATRGGMPESGDCEGETGDADSSEEDEPSETDSARPRRGWMGMGLLGAVSSLGAAMAGVLVTTARRRRVVVERGVRGGERWSQRGAMRYMNRDFGSEFDSDPTVRCHQPVLRSAAQGPVLLLTKAVYAAAG